MSGKEIDCGGDHAEHLDDQMECMESLASSSLSASISTMEVKYNKNLKAPTGTIIECPVCNKKFNKATYHKVFCSNQKTGGPDNCKDRYWNTVDEKRRFRAMTWNTSKGWFLDKIPL